MRRIIIVEGNNDVIMQSNESIISKVLLGDSDYKNVVPETWEVPAMKFSEKVLIKGIFYEDALLRT